jgi:hypothetical protein
MREPTDKWPPRKDASAPWFQKLKELRAKNVSLD